MVNTGHDQRTKKRPDMPLIINQRKSRPGMRDERRKKVRWEQGAGDGRLRNLLMIFFLFKKREITTLNRIKFGLTNYGPGWINN